MPHDVDGRITQIEQLAPLTNDWQRLAAGVPFRSPAWLTTWWQHYGTPGDLFVLALFDQGRLVGLAPWYRDAQRRRGPQLRQLGDTEVCSEYVRVMCEPGCEGAVATALAHWLVDSHGQGEWDVLELADVQPHDTATTALAEHLAEAGCRVHVHRGATCWFVPLPESWDDYLARFSKDRRKKLRKMLRSFAHSGRAVLHTVSTPEQLLHGREILVDLHQRRHQSFGEPGCFAWPKYSAFHRQVFPQLLKQGQLGLHWLEVDGQPVAAEYHLIGHETVFCYQGGISPEHLPISPGQIVTLLTLQQTIAAGYRGFDFLRGDEPYKRQWQAEPRPTLTLRIVGNRTQARLRHSLWLATLDIKHWLRQIRQTPPEPTPTTTNT